MTAVEFLLSKIASKIDDKYYSNQQDITEYVEQAKEMEKQQIKDANYDGQYLHAKSVTNSMLNDNAEHYYNETYGSKGSDECQFEPTTNTSSATICKHCGREKFMHTELQQINQDNPVTRGSTTLVPISSKTEISDEVTRFEVIDKQGRIYSQWNCSIELSYQDEGRTLKIFVNN